MSISACGGRVYLTSLFQLVAREQTDRTRGNLGIIKSNELARDREKDKSGLQVVTWGGWVKFLRRYRGTNSENHSFWSERDGETTQNKHNAQVVLMTEYTSSAYRAKYCVHPGFRESTPPSALPHLQPAGRANHLHRITGPMAVRFWVNSNRGPVHLH